MLKNWERNAKTRKYLVEGSSMILSIRQDVREWLGYTGVYSFTYNSVPENTNYPRIHCPRRWTGSTVKPTRNAT